MSMEFVHGLLKTYVTTLTRVVGPTTLIGKRGTLPQPLPGNTNVIYLAMNGNDTTGTGDKTKPVLTLTKAFTLLTGPRNTIHIFRNAYVGELIFTLSTIETLAAGENIQVEEGEIATIDIDSISSIRCMGSNIFNGLILTRTDNPTIDTLLYIWVNVWIQLSNCSVILDAKPINWHTANEASAVKFDYSYLRIFWQQLPTHDDTYISNCIFEKSDRDSVLGVFFDTVATTPDSQTINITRSIFYGFGRAITFGDYTKTTTGTAHTLNLQSTVFFNCDYAIDFYKAITGTAYHKLNYIYSYLAVTISNYFLGGFGADATIVIGTNVQIDPTLPRMYADEVAGIAGDVNGFRLQIEGKATPDAGGKYLLSSPLLGAGFGGEDIAPFDETVTGPTLSYADSTTIVWDPRSLAISVNPINPVETTDVRGSYHNTYDGLRRTFAFQFEAYANNENARKLVKIMADKGSVKFYPLGMAGQGLFTDAHEGYFDATDDSFAPSTALGYMIPANWQGFWIETDGNDYYIDANDETKFTLIDKLNAGFPSAGTYDFKVRYILVQPQRDSIVFSQDNFTAFTRGGAWREKGDTESAAFEYDGFSITFLETEDLVENV